MSKISKEADKVKWLGYRAWLIAVLDILDIENEVMHCHMPTKIMELARKLVNEVKELRAYKEQHSRNKDLTK